MKAWAEWGIRRVGLLIRIVLKGGDYGFHEEVHQLYTYFFAVFAEFLLMSNPFGDYETMATPKIVRC